MFRKRPAIRDVGADVNGDMISKARQRLAGPTRQFFLADGLAVLEALSAQLATSAVAATFAGAAAPPVPMSMATAASSDDSFRNVTAHLMAQRDPATVSSGSP